MEEKEITKWCHRYNVQTKQGGIRLQCRIIVDISLVSESWSQEASEPCKIQNLC